MTTAPRFTDFFWGAGSDFGRGVQVIHDRITVGLGEVEELAYLLQGRIATEETHAARLADLARLRSRSVSGNIFSDLTATVRIASPAKTDSQGSGLMSPGGTVRGSPLPNPAKTFAAPAGASADGAAGAGGSGAPTGSLVKQIYLSYKDEMGALAESRKTSVESLRGNVLAPLERFLADKKKVSLAAKDAIDAAIRDLAKRKVALSDLKGNYFNLSKLAELEAQKHRKASAPSSPTSAALEKSDSMEDLRYPTMEILMYFGNKSFRAEELNGILAAANHGIRGQDVKYPLLGTYKACFLGSQLLLFINSHPSFMGYTEADALAFLGELLSQGFIKAVSRGNKFSPTSYYQWKKLAIDGEPPHKKAQREADIANLEYSRAVQEIEDTRLRLDSAIHEYLSSMQAQETQRLTLIRDCLSHLALFEASAGAPQTNLAGRLSVFLETLVPDREVALIVETKRTGSTRCPTFLYEHFVDGASKAQVFGVPLEELALKTGKRVAPLVKKTLRVLEGCLFGGKGSGGAGGGAPGEGGKGALPSLPALCKAAAGALRDAWLEDRIPLAELHHLRAALNSGVRFHVLKQAKPEELVGILKLFFMELPDSLLNSDTYDTLKILYLSKSEDVDAATRCSSVRSLLMTMPSIHFHTLKALVRHLHLLLDGGTDDQYLTLISTALGPMLLKPRQEHALTLFDVHPVRVLRDMLGHYDLIFDADGLRKNSAPSLHDGSKSLSGLGGAFPEGSADEDSSDYADESGGDDGEGFDEMLGSARARGQRPRHGLDDADADAGSLASTKAIYTREAGLGGSLSMAVTEESLAPSSVGVSPSGMPGKHQPPSVLTRPSSRPASIRSTSPSLQATGKTNQAPNSTMGDGTESIMSALTTQGIMGSEEKEERREKDRRWRPGPGGADEEGSRTGSAVGSLDGGSWKFEKSTNGEDLGSDEDDLIVES